MKINAEFDKRVVVHTTQQPWLKSPMKGVYRRPLDRIGDEVARATTIVRYDPESHFSSHIHTGGEEFFVLEGVFKDEHGDYPVGSYIRNPPTSSHTPGSVDGCVIFVKLWQFQLDDRKTVHIDTNAIIAAKDKHLDAVSVIPLYHDENEDVSVQYWDADSTITFDITDGVEVLVLEGDFVESNETLFAQSWLRLPKGRPLMVKTGPNGAKVWFKKNHLKSVESQINTVNSLL